MEITNNIYSQQQLYGQNTNRSNQDTSKTENKEQQPGQNNNQKQNVQQEVQALKSIEQKVISHEMAHKAVGGQYAGAVNYQYRKGPDGRMYISGGEVSIDLSNGRNPKETIQKMAQIGKAALAPADPSPQDRAVAAAAAQAEQTARAELVKEQAKSVTKNTRNAYTSDQSKDKENDSYISIFA